MKKSAQSIAGVFAIIEIVFVYFLILPILSVVSGVYIFLVPKYEDRHSFNRIQEWSELLVARVKRKCNEHLRLLYLLTIAFLLSLFIVGVVDI